MPDFSVITQSPEVRAITQEGYLERAFQDALFPNLLFRSEAMPKVWNGVAGDSQIFSGDGLMAVDARPLVPGTDPIPASYSIEQWTAQLQQYSGTIDTAMPSSMLAIASLFMQNGKKVGLQGAQTINRVTRNRMYAAALSGWTVADGATVASTSMRVKRLNGFTTARNPSLPGASAVAFGPVSASNPLSITIEAGPAITRNVIGFTPDVAGDIYGPGILLLDAAATAADGDAVYSVDKSHIVRAGGGNSVRDLSGGDIATLAGVRSVVQNFWSQNVPEHSDGRFHAHLDPMSLTELFADDEFQRLLTSLPDYYMYKEFALGQLLGTAFYRNSECPRIDTVVNGSTNVFTDRDPFPGELTANGSVGGLEVHRMLFTAQGGIIEYFADLAQLITEVGVTGKVSPISVTNNGIEVFAERIQMVIRAPLNRTQDTISTTWKIIADWPARTDAATGSSARYKRFACLEHA